MNSLHFHPETVIEIGEIKVTANNIPELPSIEPMEEWQSSALKFIQMWTSQENDSIDIFTSGTTGNRKKISLHRDLLVNSAKLTLDFFSLIPGNRALLSLPVEYIAGKIMLVRTMVAGLHTQVVPPSSNPLQDLKDPVFDFAPFVPLQMMEICHDHVTAAKVELIRNIIIGGAPLPAELVNRIGSMHNNVYETFGMTETASHIALKRLSGKNSHDYFETLPGITVEKKNETGCLIIHAPVLNLPELVTNDCVEIKDSNTFKWLGRLDEVINSGGVKIHPEMVERTLSQIIEKEFFVSSIPDPRLGNRLILVLEKNTGVTNEDHLFLRSEMKKLLHPYECPKEIYLVSRFKRNSNGKLLRKETVDYIEKGKAEMLQ